MTGPDGESRSSVRLDQISRQFADPPKDFSPVPIWWWSADRLDRARLRWQLERFAEGGIYNLIILNLAPTGPLYGSDADDPPFLSEEWWHIFEGVCADAEEVGVRLWFYDQLGFSGANLQGVVVHADPSAAGQWLESLVVEGEGPLELNCPAEGTPLAAAATPIDGEGRAAGESSTLPIQGHRVIAAAGGRQRLRLVYAVTRGFDYFSANACRQLLDTVHGALERRVGHFFGKVIVGSFQDELPSLPTWGRAFGRAFQARKGYDIVPLLPALWDGVGPEAERLRVDFHEVRAELAEEAFFRPLFDWHERHRLLCGFDQQGPARAGQPRASVQLYADYLKTHRWYTVPGSDHHGEAKIHSSLAHLYNRPRVWIESFHSSGWGGTLEETFDWLLPWLRAGANLYNPHAVYYSTRGGWWEWAPPSTCWRQPYWRHYPLFSRAVSRLCYLLSQGDHVCELGVVFPTATVQSSMTPAGAVTPAGQAAHDAYLALVGSMFWNDMRPGVLDRDRRDFDVLDEDSIQRAEVVQGRLQIGAERYRAIVLPAVTVLEAATAAMLCRFVEGGGLLIAIGAQPELAVDGDPSALAELQRLFQAGRCRQVEGPEDLPQALADLPRQVDAPVPTLLRRIGDFQVLFVPAASPMATRQDASGSWLRVNYSFDPERYQRPMQIFLRGVQSALELWDPLSGERRPLPATLSAEGVTVEIPFDNGPAALLVWSAAQDAPSVEASAAAPAAETPLPVRFQPWQSEIVPTMDNRYGDFTKPNFAGSPPVQTWLFEHRAEQPGEDGVQAGWFADVNAEGWEPVKATFAVWAWRLGPQPAGKLPTPPASLAAGSDPLGVAAWQPVAYSLARGINHDAIHHYTLGPKGHVPEEFLDFGVVQAGQGVQLRTTIWAEAAGDTHLAIGAPAVKSVWLNGEAIGGDQPGYLWIEPVRLRAGTNLLEIRLVADEETSLRAYWALVQDAERFVRPEWMLSADAPHKDSLLRFTRTFRLPFEPAQAVLQVGADTPCRILVNGEEIGRQGGFDPYHTSTRIHPHTLHNLRQGGNQVTIEVQDMGAPTAVLVDGRVVTEDGRVALWISDGRWQAQRDDGPRMPVRLRRSQRPGNHGIGDPAFAHLWRRAHPLPAAGWLEDAPEENVVMPVTPDPFAGQARAAWLRWTLPPGAIEMSVPINEQARLWVDGQEVSWSGGSVSLPQSDRARRTAMMRVEPERGAGGGGVLTGPVTYTMGSGPIELGHWSEQGLASYSGGVRYRSSFALDQKPAGAVVLDLGQVRGTAEVWVNGVSAGTRIWSPYRLDITDAVQPGENRVEVLVLNTLAPYLAAHSPTHYTFPIQMQSGLVGPVRVVAHAE
ncbi:MAG: hypothetical protein IT329_17540 [Caldilineaceae bacterium]|nr:hypothetical protein [Caldilineaceae bacterium]